MDGAAQPTRLGRTPSGMASCTTCPYCGVGCGVSVVPDGSGDVGITGDGTHPANAGRLCSKGSALGETLSLDGRLLSPRIHGHEAGWNDALDLVAAKFRRAIERHGPDSVAFYVSGQLLTEDYYVANKLMKGFIGSANIDTNSRLCMASSVAGHRRAFGTDTVPGLYEDFEQADLVVLTGSNLAWCHPVLFQRLAAAKKANPALKVVNIDPRHTATSELADMHLSIAPGGDVALFNALLVHLADTGRLDRAYLSAHVNGFEEALAAARADDPTASGLTETDIAAFCALWAGTEKVVTVYSQGVNQSSSGSDKVNSILNCHLATGRIGRPGMGPFSVTGQPNAMGGREVGGLANMLACHLDIENPEHRASVKSFWDAPAMPETQGLKAVDLFDAVEAGDIKALWIICTNPAVSMPEADRVAAAIEACDFTVVSDLTAETDTARLADVLLPACGWGEKDGTVTNSERCISRQRAFLPRPGNARPDWKIICDLAARMGHGAAFNYTGPAEIFREYAALSGIAGKLGRDFDISALSDISDEAYDALRPFHWPYSASRKGGRFFADGGFYHADGKAKMLPVTHRAPASTPSADYPYRLNTGRVRDHWHTMTRTAKSPRLSQHLAEPFLEIHPEDAAVIGLAPASLAEVTSPNGRALLRVLASHRVQKGQVFVPMHWTGETASSGRIDALVSSRTDPVSGQPESKASVVQVRPYAAAWYGFALSSRDFRPESAYWALARCQDGWRAELAGDTVPKDWESEARALFGLDSRAEVVSVTDPRRGVARLAFIEDGALVAAFFAGPEPVGVSRSYLSGRIGESADAGILSGRPNADLPDPGATICACFNVGLNTISEAIRMRGLHSVEAIGAALQAGTNCGSCKPELQALLEAVARPVAAE